MNKEQEINNSKEPSLLQAIIPLVALVCLICLNVILLGDDTLSGANQMALLCASFVAGGIAMYNGVSWKQIMQGILKTLNSSTGAIIILLMIGLLAGTWMLSGVIPSMIYYGLYILRPEYFLPAVVVICCIVSVATGSSWSTVATVGVALLGVGQTLGFNDAVVAGAIISGAYFGDKISPLSDTTNLASATAGTDLFTHIKYMQNTTIPTILLTIIIFTCISLFGELDTTEISVGQMQSAIAEVFNVSPLLFVVPVIVIVMIAKKCAPIPTLFIGGVLGGIAAVIAQPDVVAAIAGESSLTAAGAYKVVMQAMYGPTEYATGNEMLNNLFATNGMAGMLNTVWLIIIAMVFGGVLDAGRFLEKITSTLIRKVSSSQGGMVTTTAATCIMFNMTTSDQYISIVIPGKMFKDAYRRRRLAPEVLSRTLEDAATATSVLIPWNTCGATQASVLGVATIAYLPYTFFCYLSPLMSILFAWLNIRIHRLTDEQVAQMEKEERILAES